MQKYLRGLGNYDQLRFTIKGGLHYFFNIILCGLQSRSAYNRVNMVWEFLVVVFLHLCLSQNWHKY